MTPKRIQRKRARGWRMPPGAIYVGRPTKWGNPFRIEVDVALALWKYDQHIVKLANLHALDLEELRGKDLACWCKVDAPCHADILLVLANLPRGEKLVVGLGYSLGLQHHSA
jgi:hypothetical protein